MTIKMKLVSCPHATTPVGKWVIQTMPGGNPIFNNIPMGSTRQEAVEGLRIWNADRKRTGHAEIEIVQAVR